MTSKQKFSSQMDPELLARAKQLAKAEGRLWQSILEEGVLKVLESRDAKKIRPETMTHFQDSLSKNQDLARLLAQ